MKSYFLFVAFGLAIQRENTDIPRMWFSEAEMPNADAVRCVST